MDRLTLNSQIEHLQSKHVGTGHADTTRYEWVVNQHRDTLASMIGLPYLTAMMGIAENESFARTKIMLKQRMIAPCHHAKPVTSDTAYANGNSAAAVDHMDTHQ